jgi:hypothetical protein
MIIHKLDNQKFTVLQPFDFNSRDTKNDLSENCKHKTQNLTLFPVLQLKNDTGLNL